MLFDGYVNLNIYYYVVVHSTLHSPLSIFHLLTGNADETLCFNCVGGFREWLGDDDDPWQEHIKLFPNCVYVRYVMEGNEELPDFTAADDGIVSRHKCTIV